MAKIVKEVPAKPIWEWPEEDNANYAVHHDPLEIVYIVKINAHGSYPTETCGGYYPTLEEAEKSLENNPYGGHIIETTYGELGLTMF